MTSQSVRPVVIIQGKSGILGSAIARAACRDLKEINGRDMVARLLSDPDTDIGHFVPDGATSLDWLYCSGIVAPDAPRNALEDVNVRAPAKLFSALQRLAALRPALAVRLVTFGSVLEETAGIAAANPYIASKAMLLDCWRRRPQPGAAHWLHVQLHTLYGGSRVHKSMFLGQMEAALKARLPFRMSSGRQLREYHHCDDIAASVAALLDTPSRGSRVLALHSGEPVTLGDLARTVFEEAGVPSLLHVGAIQDQAGEVYAARRARSAELIAFRDPRRGVARWMVDRIGCEAARV